MPKLLMVTTIPETLESFLLPYALHFRQSGWQVDALAGGSFEPFPWRETHFHHTHQVTWSRSPLHAGNFLGTPGRIRQLVRREGYDIVHVHTPVAAFVTRMALGSLPRAQRPRVVYTAHGFHFHPKGRPLRNAAFVTLEWLAGHFTDDLVVMSEADEAAARAFGLVPRGHLHRMPGIGLDLQHYSAEPLPPAALVDARRGWGEGGRPYLLAVAEFIPRKRHADLLTAFARLGPEWPQLQLALAGRGALEADLRAQVQALGLTDRVHFLGFRRDIPALLQGAAAVVLTSEQEGLPRCLLEAMSAGTPIVATRIRGVVDLLEGQLGLMYDVGDVNALEAALRDVLRDPAAAQARAQAARAGMLRYDVQHLIQLHEHLYASAPATVRAGVRHA
ncbi:glycosyltransferase [Deinococcus radiotolerans]|uniref:Glycosyl transferase family 1 n=1 Tax=Deinococcus radiotolerans TaxID=1309407 RepID=A0ABQ2FLH4_9DEIO|nr:glycosyltransferase [Deinococcus radiotolerans]GGL09632.1 glycosyl transferase family 1 [Deinococcus radiotolerans]